MMHTASKRGFDVPLVEDLIRRYAILLSPPVGTFRIFLLRSESPGNSGFPSSASTTSLLSSHCVKAADRFCPILIVASMTPLWRCANKTLLMSVLTSLRQASARRVAFSRLTRPLSALRLVQAHHSVNTPARNAINVGRINVTKRSELCHADSAMLQFQTGRCHGGLYMRNLQENV